MAYQSGRHLLQTPGPTNVPGRILRAIESPTIDHRSADAASIFSACLEGMKSVFKTRGEVMIYPSSGTGAWEAALVNTLNPGDRVIAFDTGQFAGLWAKMATSLGFKVDIIPSDWRLGPDLPALEARLAEDRAHNIRAVLVVHNETSTGITGDIPAVRKVLDSAGHPALLMVDTVSSLAAIDYRHDEWGVDVAISGSQKGLMLPPGLGFNAVSAKAADAARHSTMPKSYWRWDEMRDQNRNGFFPYTPSTNLLFGLREALKMLIEEEGLDNVFRRHKRHGEATRRAVQTWGLEMYAADPARRSNSVTAVQMPAGHSETDLRGIILRNFNLGLGAGLGKLAGKVFRIGHLGDFNDLMLAGTLSGVEMGLELAGVPHKIGGVAEALSYLTTQAKEAAAVPVG
jgi:alanine-glyoxylate transaminase/serine-glyoxylate transaminase/serine-pyruvate transaminase